MVYAFAPRARFMSAILTSRYHESLLRSLPSSRPRSIGRLHSRLIRLCHGIYEPRNPTHPDSSDVPERSRVSEEEHPARGHGELVECADHGIGGGSTDPDTPSGGVGYEDGCSAGEGDSRKEDGPI